MSTVYHYNMTVEEDDDGNWTAEISGPNSPLRGYGNSPLQAVAALIETIREWPRGGSDRWLNTPDGTKLARAFCPDFEPGSGGASS